MSVMRLLADWDEEKLAELQAIAKCGCGKTKDPNGYCDGSHSELTQEELDALNKTRKHKKHKNYD